MSGLQPAFQISGALEVDLRTTDDLAAYRRLQWAADTAPGGTVLTLIVRPRQFPDRLGLEYLAERTRAARVVFKCSDAYTIRDWIAALEDVMDG